MISNGELPGATLLMIARALVGPDGCRRIIEPAVADLQAEWLAAPKEARRRVARRGAVDVLRAIALAYACACAPRAAALPWRAFTPLFAAALGSALTLRALALPGLARLQLVYAGVGVLVLVAIAIARPAPRLARSWPFAVLPAALALASVALGDPIEGARRWVALGPVHLQLAELAKPVFVVAVAARLERRAYRSAITIVAATALAIALQPDVVSAIVIAAATVGAFRAAEAPRRAQILAALAALGPLVLAAAREPSAGLDLHTDRVLAAITAHAGSPGVAAILATLAAIVVGAVGLARSAAPSPVAAGAALAIAAQVCAQIALGRGLAVVSYGGSSVVAVFALFALVVRGARKPTCVGLTETR